MEYEVLFKPRSLKDLKKLSSAEQTRIVAKIEAMSIDLAGDVKRLTNFSPEYRLRVGSFRVLFEVQGTSIVVYRVRNRREVYRK